jgi:hypothetical protein
MRPLPQSKRRVETGLSAYGDGDNLLPVGRVSWPKKQPKLDQSVKKLTRNFAMDVLESKHKGANDHGEVAALLSLMRAVGAFSFPLAAALRNQ